MGMELRAVCDKCDSSEEIEYIPGEDYEYYGNSKLPEDWRWTDTGDGDFLCCKRCFDVLVGRVAKPEPRPLSEIDIEALHLASRRCVGHYTVEHVKSWVDLSERGLAKNVRTGGGAWYELTEAGNLALADASRTKATAD